MLERTDWLEELRALASAGRLKLRVAREYPPEQAGEAQLAMGAGGLRGRAVIVFGKSARWGRRFGSRGPDFLTGFGFVG